MKKTFLLVFAFLMFNAQAQFPDDVNYQSISAVTPALPALNASVTDNSLPSPIKITRISDYVGGGWNWYPHHEYSKVQPWNADSSIYKFYSLAIYDYTTNQKIRDLPGSQLYPSYWSNIDPDKLYGFKENGDIKSYSVANDQVTLLGHITDANGVDYEYVKLGPGEGNIDKNDHFVAFVGKQAVDMDVIVYDLQQNTVNFRQIFAGAWGNGDVPEYVDWVSVSQSGDYVGIMWNHNTTSDVNPFNGHYGVEIFDSATMQFQRRIADYGNHGDFGYDTNGEEVFVQFWGETGTVNMYYLDRMQRVVLTNHADFNSEGHISCRNLNRPGWAYVSQDLASHSGQIIAFKLDNSGLVEHFGHHFSSSSSYLKSPMPVPNPDGDLVMFKSDFGDQTADVIYDFVAQKDVANHIEKDNWANVQVYQNPSADLLHINWNKPMQSVEIRNIQGQLIRKIPIGNVLNLSINIVDLPKGIYTLKLISKEFVAYENFIKN